MTGLCIKCRKRPALAYNNESHCFICRKNAAAAMYRRWKKEVIRKEKSK